MDNTGDLEYNAQLRRTGMEGNTGATMSVEVGTRPRLGNVVDMAELSTQRLCQSHRMADRWVGKCAWYLFQVRPQAHAAPLHYPDVQFDDMIHSQSYMCLLADGIGETSDRQMSDTLLHNDYTTAYNSLPVLYRVLAKGALL